MKILSQLVLAIATLATLASAQSRIYTTTNDPKGNAVPVFTQNADGSLKEMGMFPTDGKGKDGDIDDQGSIRIMGQMVLVSNAGSDQITVFKKTMAGLSKVGTFASGIQSPISLTVSGNVLYVANQAFDGGTPNLSGFKVGMDGTLAPIAGAKIEFKKGAGPAQAEFGPDGKTLVVTSCFQAANSSQVSSYRLQDDGSLKMVSALKVGDPSGAVGFSWNKSGNFVYVSSFRGSANVSFQVGDDGKLERKETLMGTETAACWTALSPEGDKFYVANFVSNSVSTFAVAMNETLELEGRAKRGMVSSPDTKDMIVSADGKFLYVLGTSTRRIDIFAIQADGSLKLALCGFERVGRILCWCVTRRFSPPCSA